MDTGANAEDLDFDSVQRGNPEMQRRAQEVIDRCWQMGDDNPILSIHDVGAGGISNALPELVHGARPRRALRAARGAAAKSRGMSPTRDLVQRSAGALCAGDSRPSACAEFQALCERERCPFAVLGEATDDDQLVVHDEHFGNNAGGHADGRAARQAAAHDAQRRARGRRQLPPLDAGGIDLKEAA